MINAAGEDENSESCYYARDVVQGVLLEKGERTRMPDSFAGFTQQEWAQCYRQIMSRQDAEREAAELFRAVVDGPSNGVSLQVETWVLLALMGPVALVKVRDQIAVFGQEYVDTFEKTLAAHREILSRKEQMPSPEA